MNRTVPTAKEALARFGGPNQFVMVASQLLRGRALLGGQECGPLTLQSITPMQWCILERIGRSREQGEVTQGKRSLTQFMNENPKTLFYHRKDLIKKGLLKKQIHYQKTKGQNFQVRDQSKKSYERFFTF